MPMDLDGHVDPAHETLVQFARFLQDNATHDRGGQPPKTLKAWTDLAEGYRITQALRECHGNRSAAARVLGIGRRTLYAKMGKLGISASWRMD
ncbi:MAG: helix-turn-helix domain-containing protein [Myxococcota bacterium]